MSVVIVLAAAVILGGIVVVAMGRGGELSREQPELPARSDFRTWSDVASYRPPPALLGYQVAATEHALSLIARTIAERDAEIDWLRNRLAAVIRPESGLVEQGGELATLSASAGTDADPGGGAPGYEAELAGDNEQGGNGRARPSLSLGPRPGEGE
ncbi:MAG TPA: hypothetical protein VMA95_00555 [Streptosporangiaceae bacterium]|nr:hypothetical protein [Streptosporangiaceae bacterium]